jgi:hypothetical protein
MWRVNVCWYAISAQGVGVQGTVPRMKVRVAAAGSFAWKIHAQTLFTLSNMPS